MNINLGRRLYGLLFILLLGVVSAPAVTADKPLDRIFKLA